jgi:hypothetical protein
MLAGGEVPNEAHEQGIDPLRIVPAVLFDRAILEREPHEAAGERAHMKRRAHCDDRGASKGCRAGTIGWRQAPRADRPQERRNRRR